MDTPQKIAVRTGEAALAFAGAPTDEPWKVPPPGALKDSAAGWGKWMEKKARRASYNKRTRRARAWQAAQKPADGEDLASREKHALLALGDRRPKSLCDGIDECFSADTVTKKHIGVVLAMTVFERPFLLSPAEKKRAATLVKREIYAHMMSFRCESVRTPAEAIASCMDVVSRLMKSFTDRLDMQLKPGRRAQALVRQPRRCEEVEDAGDEA